MKKICVIGLGYIGMPTAAIFAKAGFEVVGVDVNKRVVESLNNGEIIIEEVGLPELVKKVVETGKLRASTTPEEADVFIIAVPTPIHHDHSANVDYVINATENIVPYLKKDNVVIVESTIPPRTVSDVVAPIIEKGGLDPKGDVHLAHCPERVLPGRILIELIENARIVGGLTPEATKKASEVYRAVVTGEVIETEALTAEMSKLMENTFRDVNIALANELAKISKKLGVNAHDVIQLANKHPRVNIHQPGPGVGGHCLAVDPYFIIEKAMDESPLIQISRQINNSMPDFVVNQVKELTKGLEHAKVAVLGLTYKGNIDDVRESPAITVLGKLMELPGLTIAVHDPHVRQDQVGFELSTFEAAIDGANLIIILADHNEFKEMDAEAIVSSMATPVVFDTKRCTNLEEDERITVYQIGDLADLKPIQAQVKKA